MSLVSSAARHKFQVGRVHLTIEGEPAETDHNLDRHRRLADVNSGLVELLDSHRLAATWAVGDPAHSAVTAAVTLSEISHEIALLGDCHWVGAEKGRKQFARELARRVTEARAAGITLHTIMPRVASLTDQLDLVVKQGLSAVVGRERQDIDRPRAVVPRALHYGVWEFAASTRLPLRGSWFSNAARRLSKCIRAAAHDVASIHLVIDAPALAERGSAGSTDVTRIVRQLGELHERGLIHVETLGAAAARLSDLPVARPQRSILRLAA
jgi:hypothetical protein